jgi:hypothetical protein
MIGIGAALATMGISFVKDLISDHGEDLVKSGIKKVTGIDLDVKKPKELTQEEISIIRDSEFKIMSLDFEKLKLEFENKKEINRHEEYKYGKAHDTYVVKNNMADVIAKQIIARNLPLIGFLVFINVLIVYFLKDNASLIAIASNIIGVAIGNLFNERQAIINFFFGSSIGSKEKDEQINKIKNSIDNKIKE